MGNDGKMYTAAKNTMEDKTISAVVSLEGFRKAPRTSQGCGKRLKADASKVAAESFVARTEAPYSDYLNL